MARTVWLIGMSRVGLLYSLKSFKALKMDRAELAQIHMLYRSRFFQGVPAQS